MFNNKLELFSIGFVDGDLYYNDETTYNEFKEMSDFEQGLYCNLFNSFKSKIFCGDIWLFVFFIILISIMLFFLKKLKKYVKEIEILNHETKLSVSQLSNHVKEEYYNKSREV